MKRPQMKSDASRSHARRQAHPGLLNLVTSQNEGIPAVHITIPRALFTLLYSHGNAEDVSLSLEYLQQMANAVQADVFAYEYVGYSKTMKRDEALL